jgi:hypothetical protein
MANGMNPSDLHLPANYWSLLSDEDKIEFIKLRNNFHQGQKNLTRDRRIITFHRELLSVLDFLERSEAKMETMAILTGICFSGRLVCINTRQLKCFLARCKSSINGSFQQLGFVSLRTKVKARNCVMALLPSLREHQMILRQWTVRIARNSKLSFTSSLRSDRLPEITDDDISEEKVAELSAPLPLFGQKPVPPLEIRKLDFELNSLQEDLDALPTWKMLFSMEDLDHDLGEMPMETTIEYSLRRSESAHISMDREWSLFDDRDNDNPGLL